MSLSDLDPSSRHGALLPGAPSIRSPLSLLSSLSVLSALPVLSALSVAGALSLAGCSSGDADPDAGEQLPDLVELSPEPAGSPTEAVKGRLECHRKNDPGPATAAAVELNGYVRVLADPTAKKDPPAAKVEIFDAAGTFLDDAYADPTKSGRISVSVPVPKSGFRGHARVTFKGYVPTRFTSSRPTTRGDLAGWVWMATEAELEARAKALSTTLDKGKGVLLGSVHDCDLFGIENAIVTVDGEAAATRYTEGFELSASRTFTSDAGRFAVPNLAPGKVLVQAWGRLDARDPLVLLSTREVTIEAGVISSVDLQPLTGKE